MRVALRASALRYLVVGVLSFALDLGLLVLLHSGLGLPVAPATALAYATAFGVNFALNRAWSFGASRQPAGRQLLRYLLLALLNLALTVVVVSGLTAGHVDYRLAKVVATGAITIVNFVALRSWVFRQSGTGTVEE